MITLRNVLVGGTILLVLGSLGALEYTTYHGDLPAGFHVGKVLSVVIALSVLFREVSVLAYKHVASALSAIAVGQLLYIVSAEISPRTGEGPWNVLLLVALTVFFVLTLTKKDNDPK